jgi:parvulin-like peptidyl-prolyl isomerase
MLGKGLRRKDAVPAPRPRWKNRLGAAIGALAVIAACLAVRSIRGPSAADAKDPAQNGVRQASAATTPANQKPQVVAIVNNEEIGRQELAQECLTHYGKEVLETIVNKYLIAAYCQQNHVVVTREEVANEIDHMARKFSLTVDQWYKLLMQERGITPEQYADDIIWPTLALKKLAAERLKPSDQELQDAFDAQFGASVKARICVVRSPENARTVASQAKADPQTFTGLVKKYSIDPSASAGGLIPPIHRHLGDENLERAAFTLNPGEVSDAVKVGDQYVIILCEQRLPPAKVSLDQVRDKLSDVVCERKLHTAASDVFKALQQQSHIVNVLNDTAASQRMPGVAAIVNDRQFTLREVAEECIDRHGKEVLEGTINRRLLEQAIRRKNIVISDADQQAEVARAAVAMGKVDKQTGQPDIQGWIDAVTKEQGITVETYYHDAVWPSVALKKLVGDIQVTNEDLQKGFDSNYGPRVNARVIIMQNQRKAQEVWELARREVQKNPTSPQFFAKLAEQYSIDPSRAMGGEVPPIQRWGGASALEKEAFSLKPGELSSIVQIGENYVILYCTGYTSPVKVELKDVRDELYADIQEKKSRRAMAEAFENLKKSAMIDNFLAGTVQTPEGTKGGQFGHSTALDAGKQPGENQATARAMNPTDPSMQRPSRN